MSRNNNSNKKLWRFLVGSAILYVFTGLLLYAFQHKLLFHPQSLPDAYRYGFDQPFTELFINVEGRQLHAVQFEPQGEKRGLVLFFHGNMKHVEHYKKYPSLFTKAGYAVWMADYPGFGKSRGRLTEENLYKDAGLLYEKALGQFAPKDIIIYGKSIGTGVAAHLAANQTCRRLILETPYKSIAALSRHYFPIYPSGLNRFHLPVEQYLKSVQAPVTIFHGTKDGVVPYRQGKALAMENSLEFVTIDGGHHNDLSDYPLFRRRLDSLLRN